VPPGSRVTTHPVPSRPASRASWVDLPQPSIPSNVMNGTDRFYSVLRPGLLDAPTRRG